MVALVMTGDRINLLKELAELHKTDKHFREEFNKEFPPEQQNALTSFSPAAYVLFDKLAIEKIIALTEGNKKKEFEKKLANALADEAALQHNTQVQAAQIVCKDITGAYIEYHGKDADKFMNEQNQNPGWVSKKKGLSSPDPSAATPKESEFIIIRDKNGNVLMSYDNKTGTIHIDPSNQESVTTGAKFAQTLGWKELKPDNPKEFFTTNPVTALSIVEKVLASLKIVNAANPKNPIHFVFPDTSGTKNAKTGKIDKTFEQIFGKDTPQAKKAKELIDGYNKEHKQLLEQGKKPTKDAAERAPTPSLARVSQ